MNEETNEASTTNLNAAEGEIAAILTRRNLAGVVLLTDGVGASLLQQLNAPWNAIEINPEGQHLIKRNDTQKKIRKSLAMLGVLFQMARDATTDLAMFARDAHEFHGDVAVELAPATMPTPASLGLDAAERRVPRCRLCGVTENVNESNLCPACAQKS